MRRNQDTDSFPLAEDFARLRNGPARCGERRECAGAGARRQAISVLATQSVRAHSDAFNVREPSNRAAELIQQVS